LNLVILAPLWLLAVLGCALLAAAIEDAARFRISNATSLIIMIGAVAAAVVAGPSWSLWQNLAVFSAILLLGTGAFAAGWLGGGDVKLFAVLGLWFDLQSALAFVAAVLLAGGVVAIGYIVARLFRQSATAKKDRRVPYGVAIALGAFLMITLDHRAPTPRDRLFLPLPTVAGQHHS
jgi:prepilin peptidase CpaA